MRLGDRCWEPLEEMAAHGNIASRSDLEVAARSLEVGIWGAWRNVITNLPGIEDGAFRGRVGDEAQALAERAAARSAHVLEVVARR
jgi:glutamate formiminotransferase/formiminotetrahydrofolate cyclodeaminase